MATSTTNKITYISKNSPSQKDIVLDISCGGTGATNAENARFNLGLSYDNISNAVFGKDDEGNYNSILPVEKGGTGENNLANFAEKISEKVLNKIPSGLYKGNEFGEKTLPIENGGTGATTAENARTNLGIGSVATISVVPTSMGGTGATTAENARTNLGIGSVATYGDYAPIPVTMGGTGVVSTQGLINLIGSNLDSVSLPAKPKNDQKNEYIIEKEVNFIKGLNGDNAFKIKNNADTKSISYADDGEDNFTFEIKNSNFKITETTVDDKQEDIFRVTPSSNLSTKLIQIGDNNFQVDFTGNSYVNINDPFVALNSGDREIYDYTFFIRNQDGTQQEIKQDNQSTFYFKDLNENLQSINLSLTFNGLNNRYVINSDFINTSFSGNGNGYTKLFDFLYPNMKKRNEYITNSYITEPTLNNYGRGVNPLNSVENNGWGATSVDSMKGFLDRDNIVEQDIVYTFENSLSPFENDNSILQKYLIILNDNNVVINTRPSLPVTFSDEQYKNIFNNKILSSSDEEIEIVYPSEWENLNLEEQSLAERYGGYLSYLDDNEINDLRITQNNWENVAKTYDYYWYLKFLEDYEKYSDRQDFESFKTMVNNNMGHVNGTSFNLPTVFDIIYIRKEKQTSSSKIKIKNLEVSNNLSIPEIDFKNNNSNHLILNQSNSQIHDFTPEIEGIGIYSNNIIKLTPSYKGTTCGQLLIDVDSYSGTRLNFLNTPYAIPTAANTSTTHYMGQIMFNSSNITNSVEASKRYSTILHYYPNQTHTTNWSCPEIPRQQLLLGHYAQGDGNLEEGAIKSNSFSLSLNPVIKNNKVINYTPVVYISSDAAKLAWRKALGNVPTFENKVVSKKATDYYEQPTITISQVNHKTSSNAEFTGFQLTDCIFNDIIVARKIRVNVKTKVSIPAHGYLYIGRQKKGVTTGGANGMLSTNGKCFLSATTVAGDSVYIRNLTDTVISKDVNLYFRGNGAV